MTTMRCEPRSTLAPCSAARTCDEVDDVLLADAARPGLLDAVGSGQLPGDLVREPDHAHVGDARVGEDQVLELRWRNLVDWFGFSSVRWCPGTLHIHTRHFTSSLDQHRSHLITFVFDQLFQSVDHIKVLVLIVEANVT